MVRYNKCLQIFVCYSLFADKSFYIIDLHHEYSNKHWKTFIALFQSFEPTFIGLLLFRSTSKLLIHNMLKSRMDLRPTNVYCDDQVL